MTDSTMTIPAPSGIGGHTGRRSCGYTDGMTEMTTIKVSGPTRDRLKRLADEEHLTMDAALSRALDQVEDARFWQGVRADYARLQADPSAWADYTGELAVWDAATSDGLPDE
jgi:hypothetical protein